MKNIYQCEKCGKIFESYEECYKHEEMHFNVTEWYREYTEACKDFLKYTEKHDSPKEIGVELQRWNPETGKEEHAVAVYQFKEIFFSDRVTSDEERKAQEQEQEQEQETENE